MPWYVVGYCSAEVVLTLGLCGAARAGQSLYPYPCATPCVPNTYGFGYFPTRWRQWPGEQRLEQTNPRAFGAEVLPTPEGQEYVPPPPARAAGATADHRAARRAFAAGRSDSAAARHAAPAEPKAEKPSKPPPEGDLPGLAGRARPGAASGAAHGGQPKPDRKTQATTQAEGHYAVRERPTRSAGTIGRRKRQPKAQRPSGRQTQTSGRSRARVVFLVDPEARNGAARASIPHRADSIAHRIA